MTAELACLAAVAAVLALGVRLARRDAQRDVAAALERLAGSLRGLSQSLRDAGPAMRQAAAAMSGLARALERRAHG